MITTRDAADIERFRTLIVRRLGLHFDDAKLGFLADVLRRRVEATRQEAAVYLATLDARSAAEEVVLLAQELTVAETYFFRHLEQYRAFAEVALLERLRAAQSAGVRVSVVSAGCASGEEPYSLAMTVRDAVPDRVDAVSILGVDINPRHIDKATRGYYSPWVLRDTPADLQRRWFRQDGGEFVLDDEVRRSVCFHASNLANENPELWRPDTHDIVFCRNVLMYFSPASAQTLVGRIARSLRSGGYLFLGHAETLRGLSTEFHLRHTHGTFYYQKPDRADANRAPAAIAEPRALPVSAPATLTECGERGSTWTDTIQRASERIRSLVEPPASAAPPVGPPRSARAQPAHEIGRALELLREERFAEALDAVQPLPGEHDNDAEVLLLRAVLLTHSGQLATAERTCEQLLAINELDAEAHYLFALCREAAGDHAGASYHNRVAIHLDPSFAMAHLHLGLLARRAGDLTTARRELEQASTLLEREDASRILLFGGGFTRGALVSLCRGERQRSGERS